MLSYAFKSDQVRQIFRLIVDLFDIRTVFYDHDNRIVREFEFRPDTPYCRKMREDPGFNRRCEECDAFHMKKAKDSRQPHVYQCHHGLTEGFLPFWDEKGDYIGAMAFGQIRCSELPRKVPENRELRNLYQQLPVFSRQDIDHIAKLYHYFIAYIAQNGLIRFRQAPWVDAVRSHIRNHCVESISIGELAAAGGVSRSFISHRFAAEFGCTPHQYITRERIARSRTMLEEGMSVKQVGLQLGFCDEFHFSKVFKSLQGLSPREYADKALAATRGI